MLCARRTPRFPALTPQTREDEHEPTDAERSHEEELAGEIDR